MKEQIMSKGLTAVSFTQIRFVDKFWAQKQKINKDVTLNICLEKCEATGRITNFEKAAGLIKGEYEGIFYNDSDVYKVIEGIAYSLMNHPDPDLEKKADNIIEKIAAAQQDDGYLSSYFTLTALDKKWTDMDKHEMYCGGHLMEAAIAYQKATGKKLLLNVACRMADHYVSLFGPGKRHWVPGHEEIELALIKLYHETGKESYLELARFLLDERGHGYGKGGRWDKEGDKSYYQDEIPVREMEKVSGHAVRAMYLYSGIADVAAIPGEVEYLSTLEKLWVNVVLRNMYITGGIGPSKYNEGFTQDFDLPNETAYCETCASVGMVFWNHRMNLMSGDSKYADIIERALYNGVLSGVSLQGDRFFYDNPIESDGTHHRKEWYDCSCCPTQIARFIPSIGNYVYAVCDQRIWINLYIESNADILLKNGSVKIEQITNYPWDGKIAIKVFPAAKENFEVLLRIPGWCKSISASINSQLIKDLEFEKGYLRIKHNWETGDEIILNLDMPVETLRSIDEVKANIGKVAIQRGPIVYCFEETDNKGIFDQLKFSQNIQFLVEKDNNNQDNITVITVVDPINKMTFKAVPYYFWDNRDPGRMKVWIEMEDADESTFLYFTGSKLL